jgi:chromosome partitioning protein
MPVVVVANPKGGVGKSTLSTNLAGYFASQGYSVMLGDVDRQQSSRTWLGLRPAAARPIRPWDIGDDLTARVPKGVSHVVLDTPGGLHGSKLKEVMKLADKVIIPMQPSIFDMYATRDFLDRLQDLKKIDKVSVGLVGMRVDERTIAADQLNEFVSQLGHPVVALLRDTQNYVHLAARGLSLFDVKTTRLEKDWLQWQPLCAWLNK